MSLRMELERYVRELQADNSECARPRKNAVTGEVEPCIQCHEREVVIRRLGEILKHE